MINNINKFTPGSPSWYQYNFIWWKIEGLEALNGLNVYKPRDKHSAGFVIKLGRIQFKVRYSKRAKKWFWGIR